MANTSNKTTSPSNTHRWRRWVPLGLLVMCLMVLINGFSSGCIEFSRVGVVDCQTINPVGYWVTMMILLGISISLFLIFLSSFGQVSKDVHHKED